MFMTGEASVWDLGMVIAMAAFWLAVVGMVAGLGRLAPRNGNAGKEQRP